MNAEEGLSCSDFPQRHLLVHLHALQNVEGPLQRGPCHSPHVTFSTMLQNLIELFGKGISPPLINYLPLNFRKGPGTCVLW